MDRGSRLPQVSVQSVFEDTAPLSTILGYCAAENDDNVEPQRENPHLRVRPIRTMLAKRRKEGGRSKTVFWSWLGLHACSLGRLGETRT